MPAIFLAGLDAIVGALVALLILLGVGAAAYFVGSFGSNIPFIGDWLSQYASDILAAEVSAAAWFYDRFLWAARGVVYAAQAVLSYIPNRVFATSTALVGVLGWVRWTLVPDTLRAANYWSGVLSARAMAYAWNLYVQSTDYARALYGDAVSYAAALAADVASFALTLYRSALAYTDLQAARIMATVTALGASMAAELATARAWTAALVSTAVRALQADIATAEAKAIATAAQLAAAAERDAITAVDVAAAATIGQVWPGIVTDVDELVRVIPSELTDIGDAVRAIPRVVPGDLADAMAALGVLAIPMLRFMGECGVPMCRDLHGLSDLLGDLNSVATDAALLAFFAIAAGNPQLAADDILTVARPVADATTTVARDLLGV